MKEVIVKIKSIQMSDEAGKDEMEFVTEAKLYKRNGAIYLIYEESELSGIPGCKTRLRFSDNEVQMKRIGEGAGFGNELKFEKGKRNTAYYDTPFGPIEVEVLTNEPESSFLADDKGELEIDYNISLKGLLEGRNKLNITVM